MMRKFLRSAGIALVLTVAVCAAGTAQLVRPVFTQTSLDGQLIGIESTDELQFGMWRPIAALAYGLESGRFRYKAGLLMATGFEIPLIGQKLGDFHATLVDWPETLILGREGQSGLEIGFRFGRAELSAFTGTLWTQGQEGEAPQVQYISIASSDSFQLPFELRLSASSQMVLGLLLPEGKPFHSMTRTLTLSLGDLRLSGRWGNLENEAQLEGFEFTTGVRGIAEILKGREFWNLTLERTFPLFESAIEPPIPPELAKLLPAPLSWPVQLKGKLFLQAGGASPTPEPGSSQEQDEMKMLFSWGMSATLSISDLSLRAELIITQYGETKFNFSF